MQSIFPTSPPGDLSPVAAEVERQLGGRVRRLCVRSGDRSGGDEIVLTGTAPSFYVKQLAQHAALRLMPGRIVRNDIEVL